MDPSDVVRLVIVAGSAYVGYRIFGHESHARPDTAAYVRVAVIGAIIAGGIAWLALTR